MLQNTIFIYYCVLQEFGRYGFGEKDKKEKKSKRFLQYGLYFIRLIPRVNETR